MIEVYRIAQCKFITDLSGIGAYLNGGRWNSKGTYMIYTSQSPSLSLLEIVVHITVLPKDDYCLAKLEIPSDQILSLEANDLPMEWKNYPAPSRLQKIGDDFIHDNIYLGLKLPSSVMKEEYNVLLNPQHIDFKNVVIVSWGKTEIDPRLIPKIK